MDPMIGAAAISGLAQLGGGFMSAQGAAAANRSNEAMNLQNINFQNNVNAANWEHQQAVNAENWTHALQMTDMNQNFAREQTAVGQRFAEGQTAKSIEMAREQMQFQEHMSNTAYQRAMRDMRAAGLNPILAYSQGGASTPPGAMGQAQNAPALGATGQSSSSSSSDNVAPQNKFAMGNTQEEMGRALGRVAQSAVDTYRTGQQARMIGQQHETEKANTTFTQNRAQVEGQEISNRATLGHNLQQDWQIKERQKALVEAQTGAARAASAASYANAGEANERTRQYSKNGLPGYGLGERLIRNMEPSGPVPLPAPSWPFNN